MKPLIASIFALSLLGVTAAKADDVKARDGHDRDAVVAHQGYNHGRHARTCASWGSRHHARYCRTWR